jgi:hypothetical protein
MRLTIDDDSVDPGLIRLLRRDGHDVQIPADAGLLGSSDLWSTDFENAFSTRGGRAMTLGRRAVPRTEARTTRSPLAATSLTMWC